MTNNFQIIEVQDDKWSNVLSKSTHYDFYHTQSYNKLEQNGRPLLIVASINHDFIAFPLVVRKIFETDYYDCTSAYGYCGPISNQSNNLINKELLDHFHSSLQTYFNENNIISCFSRLHPIIQNEFFFDGLGEIISLNKTVAIDLTIPIDEQRRKYRKSNKYEINKLRKNGFIVEEAKTEEEISAFKEIYTQTMQRVDAEEKYFFDDAYFNSFLNSDCYISKILLAKKDEIITAGAIFVITNNVMQYHLAGTKEEFIRDTPMKLILDEARFLANSLELEYLHLGGGVAGSDEDSLFRFKSGFSDTNFIFKIWQFINDKQTYDMLVSEYNIDSKSNYFPLYRV